VAKAPLQVAKQIRGLEVNEARRHKALEDQAPGSGALLADAVPPAADKRGPQAPILNKWCSHHPQAVPAQRAQEHARWATLLGVLLLRVNDRQPHHHKRVSTAYREEGLKLRPSLAQEGGEASIAGATTDDDQPQPA
jgi:hypothetical protein